MADYRDTQFQKDPLPSLRHEALNGCGAPGCIKGRAIHEHLLDATRNSHAEDIIPTIKCLRVWGTCPACNGTGIPAQRTNDG